MISMTNQQVGEVMQRGGPGKSKKKEMALACMHTADSE
jgi:hypothetical protein